MCGLSSTTWFGGKSIRIRKGPTTQYGIYFFCIKLPKVVGRKSTPEEPFLWTSFGSQGGISDGAMMIASELLRRSQNTS